MGGGICEVMRGEMAKLLTPSEPHIAKERRRLKSLALDTCTNESNIYNTRVDISITTSAQRKGIQKGMNSKVQNLLIK